MYCDEGNINVGNGRYFQFPPTPNPEDPPEENQHTYQLKDEEVEIVDWEAIFSEHRKTIDEENSAREERLEEVKKKEASWELMRLCTNFLKENDQKWKDKAKDEEKKNGKEKKKEANKKDKEKEDKQTLVQKKIEETFKKLPSKEKERFVQEEIKKERLELREVKMKIWKTWRGKKQEQHDKKKIQLEKLARILEKARREETLSKERLKREEQRRKKVLEQKNQKERERKLKEIQKI